MKISVIGTGYVGLVQGVVMAEFGSEVICMDINSERISELKNGNIPIFEPGLQELLLKNQKAKRISFTTSIKEAVENSDVIFIAVGTPPAQDGSADLQYVLNVANDIGKYINEYKVIVNKSTVPVGTGQMVKNAIKEITKKRKVDIDFEKYSKSFEKVADLSESEIKKYEENLDKKIKSLHFLLCISIL